MKNKIIRKVVPILACCLLVPAAASAEAGPDSLARNIMFKVDSVENHVYSSSVRKMRFATCKYAVDKGAMRCAQNPRFVVIESVHKDYGKTQRDSKSYDIIVEPISDKGTGMLTYGYWQRSKDTDVWMYLPALGKVKRMVSSSDGAETGSVFGTELSVEDATLRKFNDYTYKYVGEGDIQGRPVWIIESIATPERKKKTFYGKVVSSVDKERFIIIRDMLYDRNGKLHKQLTANKVEHIDNVWITTQASMNNVTTRRITNYEVLSIGFNLEVDDEFLTQRVLTDFAYTEKNLSHYRTFMK